MTATVELIPAPSSPPQLRPFDVGRDLNAVADLIEQCFANTLDADGQRYLRQMRAAAKSPGLLRLADSFSGVFTLPLSGYVWEEEGRLVGNLSLIPFYHRGRRIFLIANVAVHPDYRRRGIARTLTRTALSYVERQRRVSAVWLQVRDDNQPALHLYHSLGFLERARRTTWQLGPDRQPVHPIQEVAVHPRRPGQWTAQRAWLERLYPGELAWNLSLNLNALRPGLPGLLFRLLTGMHVRNWTATMAGRPVGFLSWEVSLRPPDHLWLAAPPAGDRLAARALFGALLKAFPRRQMVLDYPADQAVDELVAVGFAPAQTLIWMERRQHSRPQPGTPVSAS